MLIYIVIIVIFIVIILNNNHYKYEKFDIGVVGKYFKDGNLTINNISSNSLTTPQITTNKLELNGIDFLKNVQTNNINANNATFTNLYVGGIDIQDKINQISNNLNKKTQYKNFTKAPPGTDFPGNDLSVFLNSNEPDCIAKCKSDTSCHVYLLLNNGKCMLKSQRNSPTGNYLNSVIASGYVEFSEPDDEIKDKLLKKFEFFDESNTVEAVQNIQSLYNSGKIIINNIDAKNIKTNESNTTNLIISDNDITDKINTDTINANIAKFKKVNFGSVDIIEKLNYLEKQLEDSRRTNHRNFTTFSYIDFPGNEIDGYEYGSSESACKQKCEREPGCNLYQFINNGACFIRTRKGTPNGTPNSAVVSGGYIGYS